MRSQSRRPTADFRSSTLARQEAGFTDEGAPPPMQPGTAMSSQPRAGDPLTLVMAELRAIESRLITASGLTMAKPPGGILACLDGLDNILDTLTHERSARQLLERDLAHAEAALVRALADCTTSRASEAAAHNLALQDPLTRLPNRRDFLARLQHALDRAGKKPQPLAVLILDLDNFKPVNDQLGHAAGDELLRIVGARLAHAVRTEDAMSRLGGDEFAALLRSWTSPTQLARMAHKLLETVSAPITVGTVGLCVRPSIGIALWPKDGTTGEKLLQSADQAMYRAKRESRGIAFCDEASSAVSLAH